MSIVSGWMSRSFGQMVESSLEREAMAKDLAELSDNLRLRNVQLQEARRQLADIATIDELTGLRNRRGANQLLETEISRSKRAATPLALIMLDVDHFKFYNDTYGHPAGDVVLQKVAEVLLSVTSRAGELAVRMGGEEFMLILPGSTGADAMRTAQKVQNEVLALAISHAASPVNNCVTVSQGVVSCIPRLHTSTEELIKAADEALYESKDDGRNRATLSPFHT
jgi:diguanylate cyclase (GGDEF)-like protein